MVFDIFGHSYRCGQDAALRETMDYLEFIGRVTSAEIQPPACGCSSSAV
jgi:hypothetical protein